MASNPKEEFQTKQQKIKELGISIKVFAEKPVSPQIKQKVDDLRDNLDFALFNLELRAMDIKIKHMKEVVALLNSKQ